MLTKFEWPGFKVDPVEMAFRMPSKPEMRNVLFMNAQTVFYTCDSQDGRFIAGYTKFPAELEATMRKQIQNNPSAPSIRSLLASTVAAFAKGGKATIVQPQFGIDKGLPTEFAMLNNGKINLRVRVYMGAKATYMFVSSGDIAASEHYFSTVKLPEEIKTNAN
jgi:hypothetical protein